MTYIFDLYGTLIDIWTDEASMNLWRPLAAFYASCGADYTPEALRDAYLRTVAEEEAKLRLRTGLTFPEITLEPVFLRLLDECPKKHPIALPLNRAAWVIDTATWFRVLSRKRLRAYPEAAPTLRELRRRGHRILLLSNAQRVFTLPELELTGLDGLLDGVYISSEAGMRKPEPAFLERLLKAEG
ncbi:MAG: HAD family hydrolase, partial [bacterium]